MDFSNLTFPNLITGIATFVMFISLWLFAMILIVKSKKKRTAKLDDRVRGVHHYYEDPSSSKTLRLWHDGEEVTTNVKKAEDVPLTMRMLRAFKKAGYDISLRSMMELFAGGALFTFVVVFIITGKAWISFLGILVGMILMRIYIAWKIKKRDAVFEGQLINALELAARSLRAGHPLIGAFRFIAEEIPAPLGPIFDEICRKQSLGISLEESINKVADSTDSQDMKVFAASIMIQLRSGGNLADMMERLSFVIRERIRLNRRFRVLSAQTQFSKRLLLAMPVILFFIIHLMRPNYLNPLFESLFGQILIGGAVVSMVLGAWMMNRIARLKE